MGKPPQFLAEMGHKKPDLLWWHNMLQPVLIREPIREPIRKPKQKTEQDPK